MMLHCPVRHSIWRQDFSTLLGENAMQRRQFISRTLGSATIAAFAHAGAKAEKATTDKLRPLPKRDRVRVAFMLSDSANVIDTAGPWEVFQDVMLDGVGHPFELFTVAQSKQPLRMTGGLTVVPHYSIEDAPQPHVIVVPAQRASDQLREWLRKAAAGTDVTLSVCTGAFQLARAGLLEGAAATTHHEFWDSFAKEFPKVELRRGLRFVDNGRIATAGGLTSGIDMALHVVARYFGAEAAAATARYMEYTSEAWRT
jgi:transcriptional regulator GlxA family with amidase domain